MNGSMFIGTWWALVPPLLAILLAFVTKEVYSSLFIGVLMGGILYSGFSFEGTITHIFEDGMINVLSDSYNVGILIFLVILGTMHPPLWLDVYAFFLNNFVRIHYTTIIIEFDMLTILHGIT